MNQRKQEKEQEQEEGPLEKRPCLGDDSSKTGGVLLSNEIKYYAKTHKMIDPFDPVNLKPAGYELTLGEDYAIGGKTGRLSSEPGKDELRIPPFELAIISTKETISLPRFLIARWNLRVRWVYEGLLWTGALQVDPGWTGTLFCPIYNLSSEEVRLNLGEAVALMDFVYTTPFKKEECKKYPPSKRTGLKDYNWRLKSSLLTKADQRAKKLVKNIVGEQMNQFENRINRFGTILYAFIGVMFTTVAVLITALSILVSSAQKPLQSLPIWFYVSVVSSVGAVAISVYIMVWWIMHRGALTRPPSVWTDTERRLERLERFIRKRKRLERFIKFVVTPIIIALVVMAATIILEKF